MVSLRQQSSSSRNIYVSSAETKTAALKSRETHRVFFRMYLSRQGLWRFFESLDISYKCMNDYSYTIINNTIDIDYEKLIKQDVILLMFAHLLLVREKRN